MGKDLMLGKNNCVYNATTLQGQSSAVRPPRVSGDGATFEYVTQAAALTRDGELGEYKDLDVTTAHPMAVELAILYVMKGIFDSPPTSDIPLHTPAVKAMGRLVRSTHRVARALGAVANGARPRRILVGTVFPREQRCLDLALSYCSWIDVDLDDEVEAHAAQIRTVCFQKARQTEITFCDQLEIDFGETAPYDVLNWACRTHFADDVDPLLVLRVRKCLLLRRRAVCVAATGTAEYADATVWEAAHAVPLHDAAPEADDVDVLGEFCAPLFAPDAARRERQRKYDKALRERVAKDSAKNAAFLARKNAVVFYKRHREGPKGRRFARPRELADWDLVHVRRYKDLLDAGYPEGFPSTDSRYYGLRARYAQLERLLDRSCCAARASGEHSCEGPARAEVSSEPDVMTLELARLEQERAAGRKYAKAYRDRVAEDPAKKAASNARAAARAFYHYHRKGPPKKRFASPCELADWKLVHVRKYKDLLDAAYPDGIPSGERSADIRARYALLQQRLGRSS